MNNVTGDILVEEVTCGAYTIYVSRYRDKKWMLRPGGKTPQAVFAAMSEISDVIHERASRKSRIGWLWPNLNAATSEANAICQRLLEKETNA